jgi:hypothetical protein
MRKTSKNWMNFGKIPCLLYVNKHEKYKFLNFVAKYNSHSWKKLKSKDTFFFLKNHYPDSRQNT